MDAATEIEIYRGAWLNQYVTALVTRHHELMKSLSPQIASPKLSSPYSLTHNPFLRDILGYGTWPDPWPYRWTSGVYLMFGSSDSSQFDNQIIYVGKTASLGRRLSNWFGGRWRRSPEFSDQIKA